MYVRGLDSSASQFADTVVSYARQFAEMVVLTTATQNSGFSEAPVWLYNGRSAGPCDDFLHLRRLLFRQSGLKISHLHLQLPKMASSFSKSNRRQPVH